MATRSKRRRLMSFSSFVSSHRPDLPAIFESLNDDTLTTVLEFVGKKSYRSFGAMNKHCREIYLATDGMTKETFVYGYAPLSIIQDIYDRSRYLYRDAALVKGVLRYNRRDVLDWTLQQRKDRVLKEICNVAGREGRINILNKVWNNVNEYDDRRFVYRDVDGYAAEGGKLNVLKWFGTKRLDINKRRCADGAARYGQLHILKWLKEEKGLELDGTMYYDAIRGGHLHVMKWLREQEVDWDKEAFIDAALGGNLDALQWLHDEGCPWPENYLVFEHRLKPEVVEWLRANGYGDRIITG